jgi:mannosyltransferase
LTRRSLLPGMVLLLVLVAFALRLYRLDFQPLRGDESFTIQFSAHPPSWLLPAIANVEPNPPLYYFLLHYWMEVFGLSEFVTRYLSLVFGVLCVPLLCHLGRTLTRPMTGAAAALLVAINPCQVWHSQDVRNYTLWPALSMGALISLLYALQEGKKRYWAGYAIMTLLSLYTHYNDLFMLVFQNLFFVIVVLTGWRTGVTSRSSSLRLLSRWLVVQAVLAVTFGPWLVYGSSRLFYYSTLGDSPALWEILRRCLTAFSLGVTVSSQFRAALSPVLLLLLGFGLAISLKRHRLFLAMFLILYIVVPSVCIFIAAQPRPLFRERYLNVIAPAYYLAFAYGITALREYPPRWKLTSISVGIAFFALSGAYSLSNHYWNPAYSKSPDWRALAQQIATGTGTDDVIVLNYPDPTFSYYYDGTAASFILPREPLSKEIKRDTAETLTLLAEGHQRIWLYPFRDSGWDSEGFVETWLSRRATLLGERNISGFRWLIYRPLVLSLQDVQIPLKLRLGDAIALAGYDWEMGQGESSDTVAVEAGEALRLALYWQASDEVETSYSVFIHLVDAVDHIWAQQDSIPQGGDFPTDEWMAGDAIVDRYSILVPPETPSGEYLLIVGMYDPATGQRLPVKDSDGVHRGDREVIAHVLVL